MNKTRRIIKVFLGSPGDLGEEREAAFKVVQSINKDHAEFWGCQVELVGWEDTHSKFGRPQETINQELDQCEFFVGMIWKKWGTPPSQDGEFTSGFEEEFMRSQRRCERDGVPAMALLFKEVPRDALGDPGPALEKVLAFRNRVIEDKNLLFQQFQLLADFEGRFRSLIIGYVQKQVALKNSTDTAQKSEELPAKKKAPKKRDVGAQNVTEIAKPTRLMPAATADFIETIIEKPEGHDALTSVEAARFRLIAVTLGRQGNDEATLGIHDSNILFKHRAEIDFSPQEIEGLINSGLENYKWSNPPLWYWLETAKTETALNLEISSVIGSDAQKNGSMAALALLHAPIVDISTNFSRIQVIAHWFSDKTDKSVKLSGLEYLKQRGLFDDIPIIEPLLLSKEYAVPARAANAILGIALRKSRDLAFQKLNEIQASTIDDDLVDQLFQRPQGLKTTLIENCLANPSANVRLNAVRALRDRSQLKLDKAKELTSDADIEIRYVALTELVAKGVVISHDEARAILVKTKPRLGLGGLFASSTAVAYEDTEILDRFEREQLQRLSESDLLKKVSEAIFWDWQPELALYEAYFTKHVDGLRKHLRDHFRAAVAAKLKALRDQYGDDSKFVADALRLEGFVRSQAVKAALDILCSRAGATDLGIVREMIDADLVGYSTVVMEYLGKHGEWADVERVVKVLNKPDDKAGSSLLAIGAAKDQRLAAKIICKLGRNQTGDILGLELSATLFKHVLIEIPQRAFSALSNEHVLSLFSNPNDECRKAVALKSVAALPKSRLRQLLSSYVETEEARFYNVIHWLDFGVSLPSTASKRGALESLRRLE